MSKINLQNLPSDLNFLKCLTCKDNESLVYVDFSSLEPHVLAHYSQDPGLMSLYGPDAKANDVYLFVGSAISKYKDKILEYYNPDKPTKKGIKLAKKHASEERNAVKPAYLGWMYGLGAGTLHQATEIPIGECRQILQDIDDKFPGVVKFGERLKEMWESNGGWSVINWVKDPDTNRNIPEFIDGRPAIIYNGRNRPIGIAPQKIKDVTNRFVQSTGHDILIEYIYIINQLRYKYNCPMRPFNVDVHDATTWATPTGNVDNVVKIFEEAFVILNDQLKFTVEMKGEIKVGRNMGDFL